MNEIDRQNQETNRTRASLISQLMKIEQVSGELTSTRLTWISKPRMFPQLDIAIIPKRRGGNEFSSANLFGHEHCMGVCIVDEKEDLMKKYAEIKKTLETLQIGNGTKPEVVILTENDVREWIKFYKNTKTSGILEGVGSKSLAEFSGLERKSPDESANLCFSFLQIAKIHREYFEKHGITNFKPNFGFDLAFLSQDEKLKTIPLHHIRQYLYKKGLLYKKVLSEPGFVPGIVIQRPGEKELDTIRRSVVLERELSRLSSRKICVPVVSRGQLSLFEKWGIEKPLQSNLLNPKVDLRDLMDFLYLGRSSLNPGVLAREPLGLSLPQINKDVGADVLFFKRDENNNKILTSLNGVLGLNLRLLKRGVTDFGPIDNVGGMIIFPDDYTVPQMHEHAKSVMMGINRPNLGKDIYLLYVTSALFAEWKRRKTIFENKPEENLNQSVDVNVFGMGPSLAGSVEIDIINRGPKIGDAQFIIKSRQGPEETVNVMDFGNIYGGISNDEKSILGAKNTSVGLRQGLTSSELPLVPGIYHWIYLLASAKEWPALFSEGQSRPEISFTRAEIIQRVPWADLVDTVGREKAKKIYELGTKDRQHWYGRMEKTPGDVLLSHAHDDHVGQASVLQGDYLATWPTIGHLLAISSQKQNWWNKHAYISHVEKGLIGGKYLKDDRKMTRVYYQGERIQLNSNTVAKYYFTNHSISAAAIGIHTPSGNVFYSGDIQPGPETDTALEIAAKEDYETFLWENTNPKNTWKPSALTDEGQVIENIEKVLKDPRNRKRLVIIMAPPNHLGHLEAVYDIAQNVERKVVLSYQHADIINHLRAERNQAPLDAAVRSMFLPNIGEDVGVYSKPMAENGRRPWQVAIDQIAENKSIGILKQEELREYAENTILVVSQYETFEKLVGGANLSGVVFIYSAPYPYSVRDKSHLATNFAFLRRGGAKIYADFNISGLNGGRIELEENESSSYRWGGHATFEENMTLIRKALGPNPKNKKVYFVHGETPEIYARDAEAWFKKKHVSGVQFIGRLNRYDHNDAKNRPGHIITLG